MIVANVYDDNGRGVKYRQKWMTSCVNVLMTLIFICLITFLLKDDPIPTFAYIKKCDFYMSAIPFY